MRILFVVQRYGDGVAGGAEQHCREFATRLAGRGHRVEVLTSRALSSSTWDNHFPAGSEILDGVTVHRLSTPGPRDEGYFDRLSWQVLWSGPRARVAPALEEAWVLAQGPLLPDLVPWLTTEVPRFDVTVFFTYLFFPTWAGLRASAGRVATVLHATAHDEPAFWLPVFDTPLRSPDAYAWSTEEEGDLLRRRGISSIPGDVIGVGTDLDLTAGSDPGAFRSRFDLSDRPYLLTLGRINEAKGSADLAAWFAEYKRRFGGDLLLVLAGEAETRLPAHPDIRLTGFLDDDARVGALSGCLALVQPSYHESFSMVVAEAWAARKPVLVQRHCDVLAGQARRSRGALGFDGFAEFCACVELLLGAPDLGCDLAEAGRRYVSERYTWPAVLERYEGLLELARTRFSSLTPGPAYTGQAVLDRPPGDR